MTPSRYSRSRRRAVTLSLTAVLCAVLVLAALGLLDFLLSGAELSETRLLDTLAGLVLSPLLVGIPALLLALVLLTLDERHFGEGAGRRWALVGLLFGLVWGLASRLLPDIPSPIAARLFAGALQVATALWVYWLVFHALGPRHDRDANPDETDFIVKP